jgi:hypothetical protein
VSIRRFEVQLLARVDVRRLGAEQLLIRWSQVRVLPPQPGFLQRPRRDQALVRNMLSPLDIGELTGVFPLTQMLLFVVIEVLSPAFRHRDLKCMI